MKLFELILLSEDNINMLPDSSQLVQLTIVVVVIIIVIVVVVVIVVAEGSFLNFE